MLKELSTRPNDYKFNLNNNCYGRFTVHDWSNYYMIWNVKINEKYRNKGFGTKMFVEIIQKFNDKPLRLYVYKDNLIAIHLYYKMGFVIIEEDDEKYKMERR